MTSHNTDIPSWLVTTQNPPRLSGGLDYERCAALHNHIIEVGWLASGRSSDELVSERQTWFEMYGDEVEDIREDLSDGLVHFLQRAYVVDSSTHKFFFWSDSLGSPDEMFENQNPDLREEGEERRFLTLYPVNTGQAEHGDGLVYDQKECRAIMQMDIMDDEVTQREEFPPPWHPLEVVLSSWIEMICVGKICPCQKHVRSLNEKYSPWVNQRFSRFQVDEAVAAFSRLTEAIESRMQRLGDVSSLTSTLIEQEALDRANIPSDSFAYAFCSTARKPRFDFIAPGLSLHTADAFVSSQVFSVDDADGEGPFVAPTLLFHATGQSFALDRDNYPFLQAFRHIVNVPAGLYLTGADLSAENISEASGCLVLPFTVGDKGFVRKSDCTSFRDSSDIYQLGLPPFGGDPRPQRLMMILKNWTARVEDGDWEIGDEGVLGGIQHFQRADTEHFWKQFYIPPTW